jgi:glycerol-3-phosphate acyltransferase PlsX
VLFRSSSLNFIGNIEGRDVLKGKAQVMVCDGFVGNVILKFGESVPSFLKSKLRAYAAGGFFRKILIGAASGSLKAALKDMDYEQYGGVPVLGVNGVSIVGHGSSSPKAIRNMILKGVEVAKTQLNTHIERAIAEAAKAVPPAPSA